MEDGNKNVFWVFQFPLTQLQALHILFLFYSLEQVVKYSESNFISFSQGIVFNSFCRKYKIPGLLWCLAQLGHNISLMYIRQTFGKNFAYNDFSYFWCFKSLILNDEKYAQDQFWFINCVNLSSIYNVISTDGNRPSRFIFGHLLDRLKIFFNV